MHWWGALGQCVSGALGQCIGGALGHNGIAPIMHLHWIDFACHTYRFCILFLVLFAFYCFTFLSSATFIIIICQFSLNDICTKFQT